MSSTFREYLFEYNYNGEVWGFTIKAENDADARARVSRLAWSEYKGEVIAKVPVSPRGILGWLRRR